MSGLFTQLLAGHQYAIGLFGSPADPAPQLVKLAQTESFRTFYHHHGGVGHIHADFYHGCSYKDIRTPRGESVHIEFLFFIGLFPVYHGCLVWRERKCLGYLLIPVLQILVVHFLAFEYKRIHYENLPSERYLVTHEFKQGRPSVL